MINKCYGPFVPAARLSVPLSSDGRFDDSMAVERSSAVMDLCQQNEICSRPALLSPRHNSGARLHREGSSHRVAPLIGWMAVVPPCVKEGRSKVPLGAAQVLMFCSIAVFVLCLVRPGEGWAVL